MTDQYDVSRLCTEHLFQARDRAADFIDAMSYSMKRYRACQDELERRREEFEEEDPKPLVERVRSWSNEQLAFFHRRVAEDLPVMQAELEPRKTNEAAILATAAAAE